MDLRERSMKEFNLLGLTHAIDQADKTALIILKMGIGN